MFCIVLKICVQLLYKIMIIEKSKKCWNIHVLYKLKCVWKIKWFLFIKLFQTVITLFHNDMAWNWHGVCQLWGYIYIRTKLLFNPVFSLLLICNTLVVHEKVKVKLSLCLTKHHAMKMYWESGCISSCILDSCIYSILESRIISEMNSNKHFQNCFFSCLPHEPHLVLLFLNILIGFIT